MPVIRVCSYNSTKIGFKQKNGLKSVICGVFSKNVFPLEDTYCLCLNYIHITFFKVVTISEKVVGNGGLPIYRVVL